MPSASKNPPRKASRNPHGENHARITILERGPDVSFANCGLPYFIGGEIAQRESLAGQTPQTLKGVLKLDVRTLPEAIEIDATCKGVQVRKLLA